MKNYKLIPKVTLWVLMAIGIVATIMFFAGGSEGTLDVVGDALNIPRFTDLLLGWNYVLLILACLITLVFVITDVVELGKVNKRKGIYVLIGIVLAIGVCIGCWFLGSPEKIEILGYEGTDNVGTMAQLTDAMMYLTYILVLATVGTLVWGVIYTKTKK